MIVLLVEDDPTWVEDFLELVRDLGGPVDGVTVASSLDEARTALSTSTFDLAICDLAIPPHPGSVQAEREHGLAVVSVIEETISGMPCVIMTGGITDDREIRGRVAKSRSADIFGDGSLHPLLDAWRKDELVLCAAEYCSFARRLAALDDIVCSVVDEAPLEASVERVLKLFARRQGGAALRVSRLGGFSDALALKLEVLDADRNTRARAFAKVGPLHDIRDEYSRYEKLVALQLPTGTFAPHATSIFEGASDYGGNFYSLLTDAEVPLFEYVMQRRDDAPATVARVRRNLTSWSSNAKLAPVVVGDLRRASVSDELFLGRCPPWVDVEALRSCEARTLCIPYCTQHGDLHGENILVGTGGQVALVDFADTESRPKALDAVALELSFLFHPGSPCADDDWPNPEVALRWWELEAFLEGCPIPEVIRACREWVLACGDSDLVLATTYSHAARQVKYPDTPKDVVWSVVQGAARQLLA